MLDAVPELHRSQGYVGLKTAHTLSVGVCVCDFVHVQSQLVLVLSLLSKASFGVHRWDLFRLFFFKNIFLNMRAAVSSFIMEALITAAITSSLRWLSTPSIYSTYSYRTHTSAGACTLSSCEVSTSMVAAPWAQHSVIVVTNVNYYPAVDTIKAAHTVIPHCSFTSCCSEGIFLCVHVET